MKTKAFILLFAVLFAAFACTEKEPVSPSIANPIVSRFDVVETRTDTTGKESTLIYDVAIINSPRGRNYIRFQNLLKTGISVDALLLPDGFTSEPFAVTGGEGAAVVTGKVESGLLTFSWKAGRATGTGQGVKRVE